jgi:hypothetical protein
MIPLGFDFSCGYIDYVFAICESITRIMSNTDKQNLYSSSGLSFIKLTVVNCNNLFA